MTMQPALNFYDIVFCLLPHNNTANSLNVWASQEKKENFSVSLECLVAGFHCGQLQAYKIE